MMEFSAPLPLAPAASSGARRDLCRVWVGNLEKRVTESTLLKIFSSHGKVVDFDFLINKTGPQKGLPRGFAFITYETEEQAVKAIAALNGITLQGRRLSVSFAQEMPQTEEKKKEAPIAKPMKTDVNSQIRAIEAKLRALQQKSEVDLDQVLTASTSSLKAVRPMSKPSGNRKQQRHQSHQRPYQRPRR